MPGFPTKPRWGTPPWVIDFQPVPRPIPKEVDFAVVGGGFTGLAAAAWLRRLEPQRTVALLEAESVGAGSSGRTGGVVLAETAAGDLPGLGDVLAGFSSALSELAVDGDLTLPGAWELGRNGGLPGSPISWADSGTLRAVQEVPGGTVDPGRLVSGLAREADRRGVLICEHARVEDMAFEEPLRLRVSGKQVRAHEVLFATNAQSLELSGLVGRAEPTFTLAVATEPLTPAQLETLGLASRKPFYTVDLPYLWGRLLANNGVVFGSGLVYLNGWRDLGGLDVAAREAAELIARLERRVRGLHPALRSVSFTHRWGGPILIGEEWLPVFQRHSRSAHVLVLGAYSGHGVALSVYLGCWAAEVMLGRKRPPTWDEAR
ncbi:MAG: FAD-binding oxidoreductase [Candidatus Acidiferrales bacterium]|jgi:glycine/D-amino acid oxidase-like deaminating enzyme